MSIFVVLEVPNGYCSHHAEELGVNFTLSQCREKIRLLKSSYRQHSYHGGELKFTRLIRAEDLVDWAAENDFYVQVSTPKDH